jgi:cellobiose-specific phosphotransferase system component IIB
MSPDIAIKKSSASSSSVSSSTVKSKSQKPKKTTTKQVFNPQKGKPVNFVVPRTSKPHDLKVNIAKVERIGRGKKISDLTNTLDYSGVSRLYVTEKAEVANTIKKFYPDAVVLNLGGNPFTPVERVSGDIRKSNKTINWRSDKAYSPAGFQYPLVDAGAEVVIISDDDYLGQYWNHHFARSIKTQTSSIRQYAIETDDEQLLEAVLSEKNNRYDFRKNKAIAGTWYAESQSEIGGTITSAISNKDGIWDSFTEDLRPYQKIIIKPAKNTGKIPKKYQGKINPSTDEEYKVGDVIGEKRQTWNSYSTAYLQGIRNLNFTESDLALMQKIKQEQLSQKQRAKIFVDTESGLEEFTLTVKAMKLSKEASYYDAVFEKTAVNDLAIKNTDDTVLLLSDQLKIQPSQAEDLVKRMASRGVLSYPRTEYEGLAETEKLTNEQLAEVWIAYHPEYRNRQQEIINGIVKIRKESGEIPKSGIIVKKVATFNENTVEDKTIKAIAKANIQAALGAKEIEGQFLLVEKTAKRVIDRFPSEEKINIITSDPSNVGRVVDVKVSERFGMTDREVFHYLKSKELGTIATRTNLVKSLEKQGFLLKYKGDYKLDDRSRIAVDLLEQSDFDAIKFNKQLKRQRSLVEKKSTVYQSEKNKLYRILKKLVVDLKDKEKHRIAIEQFVKENEALEQVDELKTIFFK